MWARRGTDIQAYVDPMWSHHEGSMSIPRANLRWAHVDCRRRTHEVNVGGQHRAHVGPTYHCYLGIYLFIYLFIYYQKQNVGTR